MLTKYAIAPRYEDVALNLAVDAARNILAADNEDHEPAIAGLADRLGSTREQARAFVRIVSDGRRDASRHLGNLWADIICGLEIEKVET